MSENIQSTSAQSSTYPSHPTQQLNKTAHAYVQKASKDSNIAKKQDMSSNSGQDKESSGASEQSSGRENFSPNRMKISNQSKKAVDGIILGQQSFQISGSDSKDSNCLILDQGIVNGQCLLAHHSQMQILQSSCSPDSDTLIQRPQFVKQDFLQLLGQNEGDDQNQQQCERKCSLADCDDDQMSCEEMKTEEQQQLDHRHQINQKLIKNKNQFMEFAGGQGSSQNRVQVHGSQKENNRKGYDGTKQENFQQLYPLENRPTNRQSFVMILDKRSRSETPNKMSASDVLFRAHQKLQMRRKESPSKLLEKTIQRQKKAEEVRTQIENTKKKWYEKIRKRQEIAKQKWMELLAQRKRALHDKLEQAEERRETEIEMIREKAKQENVKFEETNYIVKMTMNNMKLDINNKMSETLERRNQIQEENKRKHHDRHLKEEAAEKRRQELVREQENKIIRQKQKREQAEQRRNQMLEQKRRAAQEYQKRIKVLQRKHDLDKISDVMSFVNNSEQLWDFLGSENDWQTHFNDQHDDIIFELISKDHFEFQKLKLKRDAELLNKVFVTDEEGNIYAKKEYLQLMHKMNKRLRKNNNLGDNFSSSSSENEETIPYNQASDNINFTKFGMIHDEHQVFSPKNNHAQEKNHTPKRSKTVELEHEESKQPNQGAIDCSSENSVEKEDSIADESVLRGQSEEKLFQTKFGSHADQQLQPHQNILTDDAQNYMLYQLRIKMSMKRNILKKCLSEDLTWADFLKNDMHFTNYQQGTTGFINPNARSLYSTPERKADIPSEYEKGEEEPEEEEEEIIVQQKHHHGKNKKHKHHHNNQNKKGVSQSSGKHHHSTQNSFHGIQGIASSLPQLNQSTSNLSEKNNRLSSVVYPSTKKKNPKNEKQFLSHTANLTLSEHNQLANSLIIGGLAAYKQKGSLAGSNTSSTQSLLLLHQQNNLTSETPREGLLHGTNFTFTQGRKSLVLETDSGRKKPQCHTARLLSGQNEQTMGSGIVPQNIFNTSLGNPNITTIMSNLQDQEDKAFFDQSHNQLITNSKPIPTLNKTVPKKLTVNANKILFPIAQQKLLLRRPGKDGFFGKFKISVKIEELMMNKSTVQSHNLNLSQPLTSHAIQNTTMNIQTEQTTGTKVIQNTDQSGVKIEDLDIQMREFELPKEQIQHTEISHVSTPKNSNFRKDSTETDNSGTQNASNNILDQLHSGNTPPTITSKLIQVQQKFLEKLQSSHTSSIDQSSNLMKKKNALSTPLQTEVTQPHSHHVESTPSPKKDTSQLKQPSKFPQEEMQAVSQPQILLNDNQPLQSEGKSQSQVQTAPSTPLNNEQVMKELLVRYLLVDNIQHLKLEDTQKTIFLEGDESNKLVDHLEQNELSIRYCRLCEMIIPDSQTTEAHFNIKSHKKTRDDLQIKDYEDFSFSLLTIQSAPGDIEKELQKEKEKALKRKVKRIKAQMISQAVNHEAAATCPGKDFLSTNKKRCQILCIELEKQVIPIIKDYDALESSLKEIIKILDMRKQADLHLMRKLKFIPILIEICKRISVCHKNEFKHLGRVLEFVIKIINTLCGLRENRNYMLQTNRMSALIELLNWCLNRPTQLFYGINFVPQLFHILTLHVKHRAPYECQQMKELFIEYLISSQITMKIKTKFQIINGPLDLSEMMGQVPMFLLKSANFLESLTYLIALDAISRPVYEKTEKIGDHVFFVIQNTELFGIIQMIATILLTRNQPFKPTQATQSYSQKVLPQTILSLAITSIKIINNVYRMDYRFAQQIMSDFEVQEQLYHIFNYILFYTVETADKQEDSKELLHETIMFIGYYCLNNEKNQALLCRGGNTIIHKLCGLPIAYFHDKKLKDILFPSLIQASYKNERCLAIMDQEISIDMIVNFIQANTKEELSRIIEEENDYQSMSSMSGAMERRSHRSPSISSTNSSQCSMQIDMINGNSPFVPLVMRFPKKQWKDAITFYQSVLY